MESANETPSPDEKPSAQEGKYRLPINVNSRLDDLQLDPYEFRVYGHVSRRAGKFGECFSRVEDMANVCKMSPRKVRYTLRILCEAGLLLEEKSAKRKTTSYRLIPMSDWVENLDLDAIRSQVKNSKTQETSSGGAGSSRWPSLEQRRSGSARQSH